MSTATDPARQDTASLAGVEAGPPPSLSAVPRDEPRRRGLTLAVRLFLALGALLALTLVLALAYASWRAKRIAEETIRRDLSAVPAIFDGWRNALSGARRGQMRSLAEEPGTKALMAESGANVETFHDAAAGFAKGMGAGAVFLFDARGVLLARSDRDAGEEAGRDFSPVSWVHEPLERLSDASAFILDVRVGRALSLVASAPVVQGAGAERTVNGVIAGAFVMDRARAQELAQLTRGEVVFLGNMAARDAAPLVESVGSTPGLPGGDVARRFAALPGAVTAVFARGDAFGPFELDVTGRVSVATALPIRSGGGEPIAALVVARSKEAEMAAFEQIRRALLGVGAAALLLALPVSFLVARRVSRPIRVLARGAEEIGRGHLDVDLPRDGGGEVGALSRAFAGMVGELKAKQELEALLAEMQRRPGDVTFRGRAGASGAGGEAGVEVGSLFGGRYTIMSVLGEGGMGSVFRAHDRELDEEVALKALKTDGHREGTQGAEILKQEIKLARMITHPNVVRVHDFGESEGSRYLTMEYIPGTTLREMLSERGALELVPAMQIAKQICRGLDAIHRAGIIHGDLKPQNVMVTGGGVAKLMDFGVARQAAKAEAGAVAGTPRYMSPEQARGGELNERSDIYSAGVVMFEMFTGRCPFEDPDMYELMRMHLNDPPPDARTLRAALPESLAQIIRACLAKSRLHRPGSAAELERLLMRVRVS
ncbi:MAG TPA: protein kinase [Vicinamibacteria bacterium]|jgi:serine/threonine-protein kinase